MYRISNVVKEESIIANPVCHQQACWEIAIFSPKPRLYTGIDGSSSSSNQ